MRQKYNKFSINRISHETIKIALELKTQLPPGTPTVILKNPNPNLVPTDKKKFVEWICAKYLQLNSKIGIKLLKKAYLQQFHVEDEYKLCGYCQKLFPYTRDTKKFCSHRCQVRFHRYGARKKTEDETLRHKIQGKQLPENSKIGILSLIMFLIVTKCNTTHGGT